MTHERALAEDYADRINVLVEEHTAKSNAVIADLQRSQEELLDRYGTSLAEVGRLREENRQLRDRLTVANLTIDLMERARGDKR